MDNEARGMQSSRIHLLHESEERFRLLIESGAFVVDPHEALRRHSLVFATIGDGVLVMDLDGRIMVMSDD